MRIQQGLGLCSDGNPQLICLLGDDLQRFSQLDARLVAEADPSLAGSMRQFSP